MELAKPRKYDTAEDLEKKVDQYFAVCEKDDVIPDRANMCLYLGISYDLYNDYENNRDGKYEGFESVLKKAQARREAWLVRWLASNPKSSVPAIFLLKQAQNGGYVDKPIIQTEDVKINVKINGTGTEQFD